MSDEQTSLRWRRDTSSPARMYEADGFTIIWDPAGPVVGEPGGWYLWHGREQLGIFSTLKQAKAEARGRPMSEQQADPDILLDQAEEGYCEERGWVEATVTKERACVLIWPFAEIHDEPDALPPDPGRVVKVTLAPAKDPATCDWEQQRWHPLADLRKLAEEQDAEDPEVEDLDARLLEAREYWEVPVA